MHDKYREQFMPLKDALTNLTFWLQRDAGLRLVVATSQLKDLKVKDFPVHIKVTERSLHGKRVILRGRKHLQLVRVVRAQWPLDKMDELTMPCALCVIKGNANVYVGNYALHCSAGDIIYIPAGVPKANRQLALTNSDNQEESEVFWFYPGRLVREGIECWISRYHDNAAIKPEEQSAALIKNPCVSAIFEQLSYDIENGASDDIIKVLLLAFYTLTCREIMEERATVPIHRLSHHIISQSQDPIEHILPHIDARLSENLTIEKMARLTALSATTFKKRFKESTGQTFNLYLRKKRLEVAAYQLHHSDNTIQKIATLVGITPAQLNNLFNKEFGCSPGKYRRLENKPDI